LRSCWGLGHGGACFAGAAPYISFMERASFYSPQAGRLIEAPRHAAARFAIGDVVRHRYFGFRGVVFDIDPVFANSEEWYQAIPAEVRPVREQPFYHLLAENDEGSYVAYVSQQNLIGDAEGGPVDHPQLAQMFEAFSGGNYRLRRALRH
jgi:heat shock protein HspQ